MFWYKGITLISRHKRQLQLQQRCTSHTELTCCLYYMDYYSFTDGRPSWPGWLTN